VGERDYLSQTLTTIFAAIFKIPRLFPGITSTLYYCSTPERMKLLLFHMAKKASLNLFSHFHTMILLIKAQNCVNPE
jgi:hypothetical protein